MAMGLFFVAAKDWVFRLFEINSCYHTQESQMHCSGIHHFWVSIDSLAKLFTVMFLCVLRIRSQVTP